MNVFSTILQVAWLDYSAPNVCVEKMPTVSGDRFLRQHVYDVRLCTIIQNQWINVYSLFVTRRRLSSSSTVRTWTSFGLSATLQKWSALYTGISDCIQIRAGWAPGGVCGSVQAAWTRPAGKKKRRLTSPLRQRPFRRWKSSLWSHVKWRIAYSWQLVSRGATKAC